MKKCFVKILGYRWNTRTASEFLCHPMYFGACQNDAESKKQKQQNSAKLFNVLNSIVILIQK